MVQVVLPMIHREMKMAAVVEALLSKVLVLYLLSSLAAAAAVLLLVMDQVAQEFQAKPMDKQELRE